MYTHIHILFHINCIVTLLFDSFGVCIFPPDFARLLPTTVTLVSLLIPISSKSSALF